MSNKTYILQKPLLEWKPIEGYEGLYEVSNMGDIMSFYRNRLLSTEPYNRYTIIMLVKNGKKKGIQLHRLVAKAFVPNPDNKPTVNHKNGIKSDNRAENLEWCTQKENVIHAYKTGIANVPKGSNNPMFGRLGFKSNKGKPVNQIDLNTGKIIKKWGSALNAALNIGISVSSITSCCRKEREISCGFKWEYSTTSRLPQLHKQ